MLTTVWRAPLVPAWNYDDRLMSAEPLKNGNALALSQLWLRLIQALYTA